MMRIDIKVEFSQDLTRRMADANLKMLEAVDEALVTCAIKIEGDVKKLISRGGRSGRVYRVGGKRAQRAGGNEPPKTDTGRLVGSIRHEHIGFLNSVVGSDVNYAGFLELGTRFMPGGHPYLAPTLEKNQSYIDQIVTEAMQKAIF